MCATHSDFLELSRETPDPKKKKSDKGETKTLTWDEIVAKFSIHGVPPSVVADMTLKQVHYALREWNEDLKVRIKLAGGEVPEDADKEMTLQDILGLGV